jgi:hypothetical protein
MGLLATLVFLVAAVTAMAAPSGTYRGKTDQGRKAYVKVKVGEVTSANVPWIFKFGDCSPRGYALGNGKPYVYTASESNPITNNGRWFRAHRHEVFKVNGGGKATIDGRLHGHFTSGKRAVGTSVMTAKSKDSHGKHTCKRTIHFSVKLSG